MQKALAELAPYLATFLLTLLSLLISAATNELRLRLKSQRATEILDRADSLAIDVVRDLDQTVVEEIKKSSKDGALDASDVSRIRSAALTNLKTHLGPKGLKELLTVLGLKDEAKVDQLLLTKIEATVSSLRPTK